MFGIRDRGRLPPGLAADIAICSMTDTQVLHVPYKGSTAAHQDLIAGRTSMIFDTITAILPQVKSGAVRALDVTTLARSSIAPAVPTIAESGVPGYDASSRTSCTLKCANGRRLRRMPASFRSTAARCRSLHDAANALALM